MCRTKTGREREALKSVNAADDDGGEIFKQKQIVCEQNCTMSRVVFSVGLKDT